MINFFLFLNKSFKNVGLKFSVNTLFGTGLLHHLEKFAYSQVVAKGKKKLQKEIKIVASKRTYYTRAYPDPNPAIIFDNPDKILRKNNKVESQESISQLTKQNSLPKELSNSEDL